MSIYHRITVLKIEAALEERIALSLLKWYLTQLVGPAVLDQDRGMLVSIYHRITVLKIEAALEKRVALSLLKWYLTQLVDPVVLDQDRGMLVSIYHKITVLKIETALEERVAPQPPKMVSYTASGSSSTRPRQRYVCVYLS